MALFVCFLFCFQEYFQFLLEVVKIFTSVFRLQWFCRNMVCNLSKVIWNTIFCACTESNVIVFITNRVFLVSLVKCIRHGSHKKKKGMKVVQTFQLVDKKLKFWHFEGSTSLGRFLHRYFSQLIKKIPLHRIHSKVTSVLCTGYAAILNLHPRRTRCIDWSFIMIILYEYKIVCWKIPTK